MRTLGTNTLARRSMRYFARSNFSVALGVAAATAVIVGALAVGDSVRGSLRNLVLTRLANVQSVMRTRQFFNDGLLPSSSAVAAKSADAPPSGESWQAVPLIMFTDSSTEFIHERVTRRASKVQVFGVDERFFQGLRDKDRSELQQLPGPDEVIINESLARELQVQLGDQITLLLSTAGGVPADSPLGDKEIRTRSLPRQKVAAVVSDQSVGALGFQSSQEIPRNVFANLSTLQDFLELGPKVNAALLVSKAQQEQDPSQVLQINAHFSQLLNPKLEDFGLTLTRHKRHFPDTELSEEASADSDNTVVYDYFQLSSETLLIDQSIEQAVVQGIGEDRCNRLLAILGNAIQKGISRPRNGSASNNSTGSTGSSSSAGMGQSTPMIASRGVGIVGMVRTPAPTMEVDGRLVPYSIIMGVSNPKALGLEPLEAAAEVSRNPFCVVNTWLAEQLQLQTGDRLQVELFEPETMDGRPVKAFSNLRVAGIANIEEPKTSYRRNRAASFARTPTILNDPNFTPAVEGITDQDSISSWKVPFELEYRDLILKQDDAYYDNHRLTPKVFIRLEAAQQIAGSRFGNITSIRFEAKDFPNESTLRDELNAVLQSIKIQRGFVFIPIRQQMLAASSGTTPFDLLFLSLSTFVIIAALMLVTLLVKLGLQQRFTQLGLYISQGFSNGQVLGLLLREYAIVATLGSVLGIPLGLIYAKLIVAGLESWWIGAISTSFLEFGFTVKSLILGLAAGWICSLLTILFTLRHASNQQPLSLLRGYSSESQTWVQPTKPVYWLAPFLIALLSLGIAIVALGQDGMARAGAFFGSGILMLSAAWMAVRQLLQKGIAKSVAGGGMMNLSIQAVRRSPTRSSLAIGLLAVASFLIASLSVFQMSPSKKGYGGFDLIGTSSQPLYRNLGSPAVRREEIGVEADKLRSSIILPVRFRQGDDASCTNLFQPSLPTFLGLSPSLQSLTESTPDFDFDWAATTNPDAPWEAIQAYADGQENFPVPVVLDLNTAMWSLKQGSRLGDIIELSIEDKKIRLRVVGLLNNSVLQGRLIISERNFQMLFPDLSGYQFFLIRSGEGVDPSTVTDVLESGLSAAGFDVQSSEKILAKLLGVQNTYISAFQSLGALGLLLGTMGLIAVQLRSVWERRRELALMQAVGFSRWRLSNLLTLETLILLGAGLGIGVGCSIFALVPFALQVGPNVSVLQPLAMLGIVFGTGLLSSLLAIRMALKLPLLASLRNE